MDPGVFVTGLVFIVVAFAAVAFVRRARPKQDLDGDSIATSPDAGWAEGYTPRPVSELPFDPSVADPKPSGVEPTPEEYLAGYLFSADDLRAIGRDQARSRLVALHYPADQIEEVLDTIFGRDHSAEPD